MPFMYFRDPFWVQDFLLPASSDCFEVCLNLKSFKPEEINVTLDDERLVVAVEAKHGEKEEADGAVSRRYVKKFSIPKGYDVGKIQSRLYPDGVLVITCPIQKSGREKGRVIPVAKVKSKL